MSNNDDMSRGSFITFWILIALITLLLFLDDRQGDDIQDLQRRVGQLEQGR